MAATWSGQREYANMAREGEGEGEGGRRNPCVLYGAGSQRDSTRETSCVQEVSNPIQLPEGAREC